MAVVQNVHNVEWKLDRSDDNSDYNAHTLNKTSSVAKVRFSSPEDFVRKSGGVRIIEKVSLCKATQCILMKALVCHWFISHRGFYFLALTF
ncbi:unnamed protein product [Trichobilharzia regenti]|nr:unnamed protein product [Trichobilharzia regenti]